MLADYVCDKPVTLCLETLMGPPKFLSNKDVLDIIQTVPSDCFGLLFDTGHPNVAGDLCGIAQRAGKRLKTLHLHDNDGKTDSHLLPGKGTIPWPLVMKEICDTGYCGPLMLEVASSRNSCLKTFLLEAKKAADALVDFLK